MAWTGYVVLDKDKDDVGIARAVWNEGQADEFTYQRRAKITVTDAALFVNEAKAALIEYEGRLLDQASLSAILTGMFEE